MRSGSRIRIILIGASFTLICILRANLTGLIQRVFIYLYLLILALYYVRHHLFFTLSLLSFNSKTMVSAQYTAAPVLYGHSQSTHIT